jgi:hypothetical protein
VESEAFACARRCQSSWLIDRVVDKKKWRAEEEEERHKGSKK